LYDRKTNQEIGENLTHTHTHMYIYKVIVDYMGERTRHPLRMKKTRLAKLGYKYIQTAERNVGRLRKRWTDQRPRRENSSENGFCCCVVEDF